MNKVLVSPEIALSHRFKIKVLHDPEFRDHLVLVAIDEIHVVSDWGQHWRVSYSELASLRNISGRKVPWLGCSATLDPVTLAEVRDLSGFDPSVRIQREPIDRPEISFSIRPIQHSMISFRDLEFLIKPVKDKAEQSLAERRTDAARKVLAIRGAAHAKEYLASTREPPDQVNQRKPLGSDSDACCKAIPKTVIYIDSIPQIHKLVKKLVAWLVKAGCSREAANNAVQAYHSELAESDKRRISAEFEKPDAENVLESSVHRIIVATDAMGMGIDNPDIRCVIQWGVPPSMRALLQRAGRAARGKSVCGEFIWILPTWSFGEKAEHTPRSGKKHLTDAEKRSMLPDGIWKLINRSTCVRKGILEFFGDTCKSDNRPGPCCNRCSGDEPKVRTNKAGRFVKNIQCQKHITVAVALALAKWREAKAASVLSSTEFTSELGQMIIPDKAITVVSRTATEVDSLATLGKALSWEWGNIIVYGEEVVEVVRNASRQADSKKRHTRGR